MKSKDVIEAYNEILLENLKKYIEIDIIQDILYQSSKRYMELEKLFIGKKKSEKTSKDKKKTTKTSKTEIKELIDNYTENTNLRYILADFVVMRSEIKKPVTKQAMTRLFNKLDKLSNGDDNIKIAMLDKSIINSWKDVFELKEDKTNFMRGSKRNNFSFDSSNYDIPSDELEKIVLSKNDLSNF